MSFGWLNVNLEPKYVYVTVGKTQKNSFKHVSRHNAGSSICFRSMTENAKRIFFEKFIRNIHFVLLTLFSTFKFLQKIYNRSMTWNTKRNVLNVMPWHLIYWCISIKLVLIQCLSKSINLFSRSIFYHFQFLISYSTDQYGW